MTSLSGPDEGTVRVSSIAEIIGRNWRMMIACILVGVMAGALAALLVPDRYTASAVVVVNPIAVDPLADTLPSPQDISTETEAKVVGSSSVAERAAALLGGDVSRETLLTGLSVTTPANSQALDISYTSDSPDEATAAANAFAEGYLSYRSDLASQRSQDSGDDIAQRVEELESQLADVNRTLLTEESPEAIAQADAIRRDYVQEIVDLRRAASGLVATTLSPGQVVDRASLPTSSSSAKISLFLAGGFLLGALCGVALALYRDRRDDRIVDGADLQQAVQAPMLATLQASPRGAASGSTHVMHADRHGLAAEAFRVLGAKLEAPSVSRGAVSFLVVEVPGTAAVTAAGLAVALVERGRSVALVSPDDTTGLEEMPGLSVLPPSKGDGALTPDAVRRLAQDHDRVVVNGTGLNESRLLAMAVGVEGVVLAATQGRSTHTELASLAIEFEQVGTPVLGTVLFRRSRGRASRGRPAPRRRPAPSYASADW